jgi:hypothetical protein
MEIFSRCIFSHACETYFKIKMDQEKMDLPPNINYEQFVLESQKFNQFETLNFPTI